MSLFGMRNINEVSVYTEEGKLIETLNCLTNGEIGTNLNITSSLYSTKLLQWLYDNGEEKSDFQIDSTNQMSVNIRKVEQKVCKLIIKSDGRDSNGNRFQVTYIVDDAYVGGIDAIELDMLDTSKMNLTFKINNITMQLPNEK